MGEGMYFFLRQVIYFGFDILEKLLYLDFNGDVTKMFCGFFEKNCFCFDGFKYGFVKK